MSDEKYKITVAEAAEILDCSKRTVYRKLRSGKLDGKKLEVKKGLKWFINKNDLDRAISEKEIVEVSEVEKKVTIQEFEDKFRKIVREEIENVVENKEESKDSKEDLKKDLQKIVRKELKDILEKKDKNIWEKIKSIFKKG